MTVNAVNSSDDTLARVGTVAPEFVLINQHGQPIERAAVRAPRPVLLVFFPLAFSGVCLGELRALRDGLPEIAARAVELLAVSVDSKFALRAWAEAEGFTFSLLSDFWPHGETARRYGAFDERRGVAHRVSVLIDRDGVIRDRFETPPGEPRPIERYRRALAALHD